MEAAAQDLSISSELHGRLLGEGKTTINLQDSEESNLGQLEVVWRDREHDVAVLKPITVLSVEPLHLNQSLSADTNHLLLVGYPNHSLGKSISIAEGKIRSRYRGNKALHIDITTPIRKGNSGGPVLNSNFQVIGVAKEGETLERGNNGVLRIDELIKLHKKMSALDNKGTSDQGV